MSNRNSTTAKVTKLTAQCIDQDCQNGNGVIVRYQGVEYGVTNVMKIGESFVFLMYGGTKFVAKDCTLRKTTLPRLPLIGETRDQHLHA